MKKIVLSLSILLSFLWGAYAQKTQLTPLYIGVKPVCDCATLTKTILPNTQIMSAIVKGSDCWVTAIVNHPPANDSVKIWIALPANTWNGRFEGVGGGGFLGGLPNFCAEPLAQGFAVGATNTGHDGGSGSFALNKDGQLNWQLIQDNAYLGIHDMTVVGKELVKAYYGKPAKYAYFVGGSTGGRQGLSEAQRYPKDYDGILSFYPATNWHRFLVTELWAQVVMHEAQNYISPQKLEALNKTIIAEVDAKDGFTDGVIENALDLKYDLKTLIGKQIGGSEFTGKDAIVVQKIWDGSKTKEGQFLWYGLPIGTSFLPLAGAKPNEGAPFSISVEWVAYFLKSNPKWTGIPLTMDEFQLLYNQSVEQYGSIFGTDNPDLQSFKNNNGKLLIIHGLSDRLIVPQGSIDYYKRVQTQMGGSAKTQDFARLFLIPGLDHDFTNPQLRPINHFDALMDWVENKQAPEKIKVEHQNKEGKVTRTAFYNFFK
jgi:Tannase and feruloyl esterase